MKRRSIHSYIVHYQRIQFIGTVSVIFILTAILLLFYVQHHALMVSQESEQFITNSVNRYFENYDTSSQLYNQNQAIRNMLRYVSDHPASAEEIGRNFSNDYEIPVNLSIYSNRGLICSASPVHPTFPEDLISSVMDDTLIMYEGNLFYLSPYYNFTQTKTLGYLCYYISTAKFQNYIIEMVPSGLYFSLAESTGTVFYSNLSNPNSLKEMISLNSGIYSCKIFYDLNEEYHTVWLLLLLLLTVCIFSLVLGIAYCSKTARKLAAPINQLVISVDNTQAGKLDELHYNPSYIDEIDRLSGAYEDLLMRIQTLIIQNHEENLLRIESKLDVLQERINPHFLFNTLELISSQAVLEDAEKTAVLAQKLGTLFRYSLRAPDLIPLQRELQYTYDYLFLQNVRFNEMIHYTFDTDRVNLDFLVPKLTLQPILENCFKHAFEDTSDEHHAIFIQATEKDGWLNISVTDDGCGISPEQINHIHTELLEDKQNFAHFIRRGEHIGLRNVNARLSLYFEIEQALFVSSAEPCGTRVTIHLPIQKTSTQKRSQF